MILNKNPNFNKGINKILKMIAMLNHPVDTLIAFIIERFPVGCLTYNNLLSFFLFLAKTEDLSLIMSGLFAQGFFERHLKSFSMEKVSAFNARVAYVKGSTEKLSFLPSVAGQVTNLQ